MAGLKFDKNYNEINKLFGIIDKNQLSSYEANVIDKFDDEIKYLNSKSASGLVYDIDDIEQDERRRYSEQFLNNHSVERYIDDLYDEGDEFVVEHKNQEKAIKAEMDNYDVAIEQQEKVSDQFKEALKKYKDEYAKIDEKFSKQHELIVKKRNANSKDRQKAEGERLLKIQKTKEDLTNDAGKLQADKLKLEKKLSEQQLAFKKYSDELSSKYKEVDDSLMKKYRKMIAEQQKTVDSIGEIDKKMNVIKDKLYKETQAMNSNEAQEAQKARQEAALKKDLDLLDKYKEEKDKALDNINEAERFLKGSDDKLRELYPKRNNLFYDILNIKKLNKHRALEVAEQRKIEIQENLKKIAQYRTIKTAMANRTPKVTSIGIARGIKVVKNAYDTYKSRHNIIARALKFLPFLSAHDDYNEYSKVRDNYTNLSGVPRTEVDKYLDDNLMTGKLKAEYDKVHESWLKDEPIKAYNNDYTRNPNSTPDEYVDGLNEAHKGHYGVPIGIEYSNFYGVNKEFNALNELGDLQRKDPNNQKIKAAIDETKRIIVTSVFGSREKSIQDEIAEALKPSNERKKFIVMYNAFEKTQIPRAEHEYLKIEMNKENAVLYDIDKEFGKAMVNDEPEKVNPPKQIDVVEANKEEKTNEDVIDTSSNKVYGYGKDDIENYIVNDKN